jgi:hypothetical protein
MDVDRLDAPDRALSSAGSRRWVLVVALGASLALSGAMLLATLGGAAGQASIFSEDPPDDPPEPYYPDDPDPAADTWAEWDLLGERWESGETWGDDPDEPCAPQYTNRCLPYAIMVDDISCADLVARGATPIYLTVPAEDPFGLDVYDGVGDGIGCE